MQPILAALITPAMAYAGLGAAALPILIHLFNRRRFRRIRWAATDFLLEAERRNRRRTRLEEMILLALRCLAMLLLGMVLARWFVQPQSLVGSLGASARTDHIILLDDSFSMAASSENAPAIAASDSPSDGPSRTVFDDAKSAVQRVVDHIRQVAPEDSVTLLVASRPDRPVHNSSSIGRAAPQRWTDDIRAMQPTSRAGNTSAAMKAVRELLDARQSTVRAAVYVISDFQAIDWTRQTAVSDASPANASQSAFGPGAALAGWTGRDKALELVLIDVGRPIPSNLSVAAISSEQAQSVVGVVGRYSVRIENFGTEPSQSGDLQVFMGDTALPPVPVPVLAPNQSADVPVEIAFGQEGSQRLTVQLGPDALPADNLRSCAVPVARALRLLIVNGEASPDPYQDEAFLLNVALRPEGPEFSGNETVTINEDEFEVADLADYHTIMLLNVNRITQDMAGRLERFASDGGGVVFFLGDQVDSSLYNRLLYRDASGILPAKLGDQVTVPADQPGSRLATSQDQSDEILRLGSAAAPLLSDALVWHYFSTEQSAAPDGTASSPSQPPPANAATSRPTDRAAARILLALDDAERTPLLIHRPFGRGQVLLFSSSADKEWNNLADQPVYVVLLMELVQHVARPSDEADDQLIGEPIRMVIDPASFTPAALLKLPTYPSTPAVRVEARPNGDTGQTVLEWTNTDRPGLYAFDLNKTSGDTVTRQVAVNLDPRESDLRRADRNMLLASMGGLPATYVTADALADRTQAEARHELWPVMLVLLVAVLMLEQALAWWFGADRSWQRAVRWTAS